MGIYGVLQVLGVLGNTGGLIESTVGYRRVLQVLGVILGANREYCGDTAEYCMAQLCTTGHRVVLG